MLTLTELAGVTVQQAARENVPGALHTHKESCPLLLCSLKNALKPKSFMRGCSKCPAALLQAFHWEQLSSSQPGLDLRHCRGSAQKGDLEFMFLKEDNIRAFTADQCTRSITFPVTVDLLLA